MTPRPLSDERGITLIELLVGMVIGIVVLGGIVQMVTVTAKSSGRVSERVAADKAARPAFLRLMNELHSTCVMPQLAPVQAGSTSSSITFIQGTGSAVTVTPNKRVVTFNKAARTLTDTAYPATGGTAPAWTFSSTPSSVYKLSNVDQINGTVPIFSYYAIVNGQISPTPLSTTPSLSAANAAKTVQVDVNLAVYPQTSGSSDEPGAPIELTDSAILRFTPTVEENTDPNVPCT